MLKDLFTYKICFILFYFHLTLDEFQLIFFLFEYSFGDLFKSSLPKLKSQTIAPKFFCTFTSVMCFKFFVW